MEDFLVQTAAVYDRVSAPEPNQKNFSRRNNARQNFIGFGTDLETIETIRAALEPSFPLGLSLRQATFRESLEVLRNIPTPETILIDLSGEEQPLTAMVDLEAVVDPGTRVLALGTRRDVGFYRSLTRSLGVKEYLPKPVTSETVAREFLPWTLGQTPQQDVARGGTLIAVRGACGGVGSSTVAVNLAWVIGSVLRRHTILLDTDLHTGSGALMLNSLPSSGLRTALETPDRIDPLLVERAAQPITERLHVLAAEEPLTEKWHYKAGAAAALESALRQRYNFVVIDSPLRPLPFSLEMQAIANFSVFVLSPTSTAVRNVKRRLAASANLLYNPCALCVVSYAGHSSGLSKQEIEQELGVPIVAVIPDLPRKARRATDFGEILAAKHRKFRNQIAAIAQAIGATSDGARTS